MKSCDINVADFGWKIGDLWSLGCLLKSCDIDATYNGTICTKKCQLSQDLSSPGYLLKSCDIDVADFGWEIGYLWSPGCLLKSCDIDAILIW